LRATPGGWPAALEHSHRLEKAFPLAYTPTKAEKAEFPFQAPLFHLTLIYLYTKDTYSSPGVEGFHP
jgi:hypothetical protein